ncbi:hypothetical protein A4X13_0g5755 [Tilletia indica]|uniref:Major facilitator superfamily (MFS) profile domain-containing protein n=1 Tax=Tilletia indica TaxID=43049 RepID=A0A177TKU1_9BASI|nr:hypothetical protein A4X13_0g5755 [Tilletia indica]
MFAATRHAPDPTQLSSRQKLLMLVTLCLAAYTTNIFAAAHLTSFPQIARSLDATVAEVANTIGIGVLGLGAGPLLWNPLSLALGQRTVLLLAWALYLPCLVWCAESTSFNSFAAARFFAGACASVAQTVPAAMISHVWTIEYRGTAIAAWTLAMIAGPGTAPLINAALNTKQKWTWMYWLLLILAGFVLVLIILFVPETQVAVATKSGLMVPTFAGVTDEENGDVKKQEDRFTRPDSFGTHDTPSCPTSRPARRLGLVYYPWKEPLRFLKAVFRPIHQIIYFPITSLILWNGWVFCCALGGAVLLPEEFLRPPFSYTPVIIGTLFLAVLVGAIPGKFLGGWAADITVTSLTRRSKHGRQPELRMPALVIPISALFIGGILFGDGLQREKGWVESTVGLGLFYFGVASAQGVVQTYLVECDLPRAGSTITLYNLIKHVFGFAGPFFIPKWAVSHGIRTSFIIQGVITLGSGILLVVVLMIFGRRIRRAQGTA